MPRTGSSEFELSANGWLLNTAGNVNALRKLWLDHNVISAGDLGPGRSGDFDHGAWHVACHLAAAAGVLKTRSGRAWIQIEYDPGRDDYFAGITAQQGAGVATLRLDSPEGRALSEGAEVLGFVEGTSVGRCSARGVNDPPTRFNGWCRQDFDQSPDGDEEGGRVWEHWCTLRDIRPSDPIGSSVLTAYVSLVATLGPRFVAIVARGRNQYSHPTQLRAMVEAGLTTREAATWDTMPVVIPAGAENVLKRSESDRSLAIAAELPWKTTDQTYFMFSRKIGSFVTAARVRALLGAR